MTATASLQAAARADLPGLRARYPGVFTPDPRRRAVVYGTLAAAVALFVLGLWRLDVSPLRILMGLGQLGSFVVFMLPPDPGSWPRALAVLRALGETVAIAFLATILAAAIALPVGFLAARNTTPFGPLRFGLRRILDALRSVDALIWALIWINVVGLGPFAGMLAIMTNEIGTFGKLFSEAIEGSDEKAGEGVVASGGGPLERVRFGIMPGVMPVIFGQMLYQFESSTRSSTIIGIVGAGGIGLYLTEMIRTLEWRQVSFVILLILVTVALIDWVSGRLRFAMIGRAPAKGSG